MDTITYEGYLEVDCERGVIYFHSKSTGITILRICGIRENLQEYDKTAQLDITIKEAAVGMSKLPK